MTETESETFVEKEPSVGLEFTSNRDGTCYVTGIGTCTDTDVVIPSISPDGDSVTSIGNGAFYDCSSLTSVTFGNPNGWWVSTSSTATSGTTISATDLANKSTAATCLKSTYRYYFWYRS